MKLFNENSFNKIANVQLDNNNKYEFMYNFLSINKQFIIDNTTEYTIEALWYSEYYWLNNLMKKMKIKVDMMLVKVSSYLSYWN